MVLALVGLSTMTRCLPLTDGADDRRLREGEAFVLRPDREPADALVDRLVFEPERWVVPVFFLAIGSRTVDAGLAARATSRI